MTNEKFKAIWRQIKLRYQPHDIKLKMRIQERIDALRNKLGNNVRINLWQFSNGTDSMAGYSYKYMNIIFESHPVNSKSLKDLFRNTPVEDYLPILDAIQDSQKYFVGTNNSDIAILRAGYDMLGIEMGIDYKFNDKDVYKGFLSVGFFSRHKLSVEEIQEIEATATYVFSLIKTMRK